MIEIPPYNGSTVLFIINDNRVQTHNHNVSKFQPDVSIETKGLAPHHHDIFRGHSSNQLR